MPAPRPTEAQIARAIAAVDRVPGRHAVEIHPGGVIRIVPLDADALARTPSPQGAVSCDDVFEVRSD